MKKGQITEEFGKLLIAVVLLVVVLGIIILFTEKGQEVLDKLREIIVYG